MTDTRRLIRAIDEDAKQLASLTQRVLETLDANPRAKLSLATNLELLDAVGALQRYEGELEKIEVEHKS